MKRRQTKHLSFLSLLLTLFSLMAFFSFGNNHIKAQAEDTSKVKVGWYQSENFQEGLEGEEKYGYSYEYLQKIASYSNWSYEYVYGEWGELFNDLKDGNIDVLAGVSRTAEREEYMSFPNYEMGNEAYYIYQHAKNKTMKASDISTFNNKKIGAIENNLMTTYLEKWNEENNANLNIIKYASFSQRDEAFANNEIDGLVSTDNNVSDGELYAVVTKVGEDPYYLAVNKSRADLLLDLNESLALILETDPYFLQNLQYEYFGSRLTNSSRTDLEINWLNEHSSLRIGYLNDYLPYSGTDKKGNATGLMTDVIEEMMSRLNLPESFGANYVPYKNYDEMIEAVNTNQIDTAFPVSGNAWNLEQDNIDASNIVVAAGMNLVFKDSYDLNDNGSFAINKNNRLQYYYAKSVFPNSTFIEYNSIYECLNAVLNGKAKYTIVNGLRVNIFTEKSEYNSLSTVQLHKKDNRYFGVKHGNTGLLLLLNRGLSLIGSEFGINASYSYIDINNSFSLKSYLIDHTLQIAFIGFSIILIIAVLFTLYIIQTNRTKKQIRANLAENQKLTILLEENNTALKDKASEVEKINEEQLAQIEEIEALNNELQEKQTALEELTEEQSASIEEIKELNNELQVAKESSEAASNAKTSFLFNMSHDIRTPMNAIIGFRDLLEKNQEDPVKRADYLKKIDESSKILLSIINNVLEMARIEKGVVDIFETATSIDSFVDSLYSQFEEMMKTKNIEFTSLIKTTNHYIHLDLIKNREIFYNLLSNAFKYTNEGGKVTLSIEEIPSNKEGYASFKTTITDTGIGMSEEYLPHIFEEFSRESNTTEQKVEGTGLGLPIVKHLLDILGGTIEVKSEKGVGTTFVVTMSYRIADKESLESSLKAETNQNAFTGKKILLAEDNDFNAEIAVSILEEAGFIVTLAQDGEACYNELLNAQAGYFDCVLMDVQMPKMNGYETTKMIRNMGDKQKASTPIIAMTANAFAEDRKEALKAGMNDHLAKPINVSELMRVLGKYIS